jgi:hypothetical protein
MKLLLLLFPLQIAAIVSESSGGDLTSSTNLNQERKETVAMEIQLSDNYVPGKLKTTQSTLFITPLYITQKIFGRVIKGVDCRKLL